MPTDCIRAKDELIRSLQADGCRKQEQVNRLYNILMSISELADELVEIEKRV